MDRFLLTRTLTHSLEPHSVAAIVDHEYMDMFLLTGTLTHSLEPHSVAAIVDHEYMDRFLLLEHSLTHWSLTQWQP